MAIEFDKLPPQIQNQVLKKTGAPQHGGSDVFGNARIAAVQPKGGKRPPQKNKYNSVQWSAGRRAPYLEDFSLLVVLYLLPARSHN